MARRSPGKKADSAASARRTSEPSFDGSLEYTTSDMVLFWQPPSVFSQWTPAVFIIDNVRYKCAEQYMMAEKAKLFGDADAWQNIMKTADARNHKKLGRHVSGYDQSRWDEHKKSIVARGSYAKFCQNRDMEQHLLDTGEKLLVEASPLDTIWGIGLRADNPASKTQATWLGQNLLGEILQEVRTQILSEKLGPSDQTFDT